MSPTHSNKLGVRYRYYVSHAAVQRRKQEAGTIARVPAPEIETLVVKAIRVHLGAIGHAEHQIPTPDHDLIERHVERIVIKPKAIEVQLAEKKDEPAPKDAPHGDGIDRDRGDLGPPTLALPWAASTFSAVKGILHAPEPSPTLQPEMRDALLTAIAKARGWIDDLLEHRIASFGEIAARECKAERHIRLLTPLAFTSPRTIAAIIDGTAPVDLTITGLARALPHSWAEQERQIGRLGA
jgi:site-specific DNA recombinase